MRISTGLVLALGLAVAAGCKKKKDEGGGGTAGTGDMAGTGSGTGGMAGTGSGSAAEPEKTLTGADLAKRYQECAALVNAGDTAKFKTMCLADDFKGHDAAMNMDMTAADVDKMFGDMKKTFPDMKMEPQLILVNGRNIAAVALTTGTMQGEMDMGPMGKVPATNKKTGMMFFQRLKLNDANKTTEEWVIMDVATMMGQLGMSPKEAPPVRPVMDKGMDGAPMVVVAADDEKEKANLLIFKKGNDAFNAHKAADMMAIMAPDVVEADMATDKDVKGAKEVQKGLEMFWKAFPDGKVEVTESWAAGDYVVGIGKFTGTNKGAMGKMKATGKAVTMEYAEIAQFKDNKVVQMWRFRDGFGMAAQLGLVKMPAGGGGAGGGSAAPADPKKGADKGGDKGGDKAAPADDKAAAGDKKDDSK